MGLYCRREGRGPILMLIHGWGLHGGVWEGISRHLSGRYRVLRVDLPGHGRSRDSNGMGGLDELAQEILHTMEGPGTVIGWSLGALPALTLALRSPRMVQRLVLVSATPRFVQASGWPCALPEETLAGFSRDLTGDYQGTLQRFLSLQVGDAATARGQIRALRSELRRYGAPQPEALQAGLQLLQETDMRPLLASISQPVQLIHGTRDRLAPLAAAQSMAAQLRHARLDVLDNAAHAPFLSHPNEFLVLLEGFLQHQSRSTTAGGTG